MTMLTLQYRDPAYIYLNMSNHFIHSEIYVREGSNTSLIKVNHMFTDTFVIQAKQGCSKLYNIIQFVQYDVIRNIKTHIDRGDRIRFRTLK